VALKDDPRRLDIASYPLRIDTRVLYADMDAFRHVNNGATGRYLEEGRADLNMRVFGTESMIDPPEGMQLLFATVTVDYLLQAYYPGQVTIASGLKSLGRSSYVIAQAAFQNGACFALAEAVMVKAIDGRPAPLSDAEREGLAAFLLPQ
jgi:acyl-CoA thioester hydrolase